MLFFYYFNLLQLSLAIHNMGNKPTHKQPQNLLQSSDRFRQSAISYQEAETNGEILDKITNQQMKIFPHCLIGAITGRDKLGFLMKGSGAMVSGDLVVTAAHTIFSRKQGPLFPHPGFEETKKYSASYKNLRFYPAVSGQLNEQQGLEVESWRFPINYSQFTCENYTFYDYAILKLVRKIQGPLQFLKPTAYCQKCLIHQNQFTPLKIFGYPFSQARYKNYTPLQGDLKGKNFMINQYGLQRSFRIKQIKKDKHLIAYLISTYPGQSGCPLLFGNYYIGIHIRGNEQEQLNSGRLFSQEIIELMATWGKQLNGDPFQIGTYLPCSHLKSKLTEIQNGIIDQSSIKSENDALPSAKGYYEAGMQQYRLKKYQQAVRYFEKAINLDFGYLDAYLQRGNGLRSLELYDLAINSYSKAIYINPKCSEAYNERGLTLFIQKHPLRAIQDYDKAIQIDPRYSKALCNRGVAYDFLKEYQRAIRNYYKAIQIDPMSTNAYFNLGMTYLNMKDFRKSIKSYDKLIDLVPQDCDAYKYRALAFSNLNEFGNAITSYDKAILLYPKQATLYKLRGLCYIKLGDNFNAIKNFHQALNIHPNDFQAQSILRQAVEASKKTAKIYINLKQYKNAIKCYDELIKINPKSIDARYDRGNIYLYNKQYTKAFVDFKTILSFNPKNPLKLINLAKCFDLLGEKAELADCLKKCKEIFRTKAITQTRSDYQLSEEQILFIRNQLKELSAHLN